MEIPVKPTLQDWTQARIQEKRQQGLEEKRVHQNIQEKGNQKILRLILMTREGGAPRISWKWQIIAKFMCISLKYWNIFEHPDGGDIPVSGNGTVVSRSSRSWFLLRCPAQTTVSSATLRKTVVFTTFYCYAAAGVNLVFMFLVSTRIKAVRVSAQTTISSASSSRSAQCTFYIDAVAI